MLVASTDLGAAAQISAFVELLTIFLGKPSRPGSFMGPYWVVLYQSVVDSECGPAICQIDARSCETVLWLGEGLKGQDLGLRKAPENIYLDAHDACCFSTALARQIQAPQVGLCSS